MCIAKYIVIGKATRTQDMAPADVFVGNNFKISVQSNWPGLVLKKQVLIPTTYMEEVIGKISHADFLPRCPLHMWFDSCK